MLVYFIQMFKYEYIIKTNNLETYYIFKIVNEFENFSYLFKSVKMNHKNDWIHTLQQL